MDAEGLTQKERIVQKLGGVRAIARILGLDPTTVSGWRDFIPAHHHETLVKSKAGREAGLTPADFIPVPTKTK